MPDTLKIYQANLRKQRKTHHSIMNDSYLSNFGLLLIFEPNNWRTTEGKIIADPSSHFNWQQFLPTKSNDEGNYLVRSLIWTNKSLHARQIPIPLPDLTAVKVKLEKQTILAVSVYIPPKESGDILKELISLIRTAIKSVSLSPQREVELIIAGDFNRHSLLWGGSKADLPRYRGEATEIIDFMADLGLQSLLPQGTLTFKSTQGSSTIDLMLVSPHLVKDQVKYLISNTNHV